VYSQYAFRTYEPAVRAALSEKGLFPPSGVPPRISFDPRDLCEDSGMTGGYSAFTSYSNPALARVWNYLHSSTGVSPSNMDFIRLPAAIGARSDLIDGANLVADFDHASRALAVRANPDPRAYLVFRAETVPDWAAAEALMAARRDFHATALVEEGAAPDYAPAPARHGGTAAITRFEAERVVVRTSADAPAILVLAEPWYPGWRATIGGRPAEVFPVNGWMRGLVVPAGQSDVEFTFHSRLLAAGLGISLASAALVLALLLRPTGQTDSSIL
jgi:hypothetical protein